MTEAARRVASALGKPAGGGIPILIPVFNNPTYLARMVAQCARRGLDDLVIFDNASAFPKMAALLDRLAQDYRVVRLEENFGPRLFADQEILAALPEVFCLTDPDLDFNPRLPADFLAQLQSLTERFKIFKAGFCLDIASAADMRAKPIRYEGKDYSVAEWEGKFWRRHVGSTDGGDPVFRANIDTTFALYNKAHLEARNRDTPLRRLFGRRTAPKYGVLTALRVGGAFTCRHLPWYDNGLVPHDEEEFYRRSQKWSSSRNAAPERTPATER